MAVPNNTACVWYNQQRLLGLDLTDNLYEITIDDARDIKVKKIYFDYMFTKLSQELAHIGDIDAHQHRTFKQNSLKSIDYEFLTFFLDDEIFHRKYSSSLKAS